MPSDSYMVTRVHSFNVVILIELLTPGITVNTPDKTKVNFKSISNSSKVSQNEKNTEKGNTKVFSDAIQSPSKLNFFPFFRLNNVT